ncbi:hypothetical protein G6L37_06470 [Agrobacterium rubi]|nr:hypothetical protein [Agrobacterium rubi]NTF25007.1 hypothetical protein [Agrobacterium rubi]
MKAVFALQPLRKSIFLAGPTPRPPRPGHEAVPSWRPEALAHLAAAGFDGDVYVPEAADWLQHDNYVAQVRWEWEALAQSTVVAFWIPREILQEQDGETSLKMPAFTTNVEFGLYAQSGRAILGYPPGAEKLSYLAAVARKYKMPVYEDTDLKTFMGDVADLAYTLYK